MKSDVTCTAREVDGAKRPLLQFDWFPPNLPRAAGQARRGRWIPVSIHLHLPVHTRRFCSKHDHLRRLAGDARHKLNMALPLPPGLTPSEVGFLCEMELVTVIPRQRLESLELLGVSSSRPA